MRSGETKGHEISCNSIIMRGKCYGDKETRAKLKMGMGKCDQAQTGESMLLVTDGGLWRRRGHHCTFSPSVSCTSLGSAARLARPLAWAI